MRSNQLSSLTNGISPLRGLASLIELLLEGNEMCSSVEKYVHEPSASMPPCFHDFSLSACSYRDDVKSLLPQLETIDSVSWIKTIVCDNRALGLL